MLYKIHKCQKPLVIKNHYNLKILYCFIPSYTHTHIQCFPEIEILKFMQLCGQYSHISCYECLSLTLNMNALCFY